MAAEVEEEGLVHEVLRDLLDRVVAVEELIDLLRQVVDLVEDEGDLACGIVSICASFSATR